MFVTGCGSGFGLALTRHLLAGGDHVIGTERDVEGVAERVLHGLPGEASSRFVVRALELLEPRSIERATADVGSLDVLVNNAGYALFATQAEGDPAAVEAMFRANVFGMVRVTRRLLPQIRSSSGVIVQLSSVAGRMAFPESGFYAATKFAVEGLSEALYVENCSFGVRVVVVEPGSFDTGFLTRAVAESPDRAPDSPYAALFPSWDEAKFGVLETPQAPQWVAEAITNALESPQGFQRVVVGADAQRILALRDAMTPDGWVRLMGERNGGPPCPELPRPEDVVGDEAADSVVQLAARSGHLSHWAATEQGRAALRRLGVGNASTEGD